MPGTWTTDKQVEIYMKARLQGCTQEVAAAKSGVSVRTGRDIEQGKWASPHNKDRHWRTRNDPLAKVWEQVLEPMLEATPALSPMTLLEYLQAQYPDQYEDSVLRTLQRRVKLWRATSGPDKEVMFRQKHEPARQGLSDFTHLKDVAITIADKPFSHMLYHFRLVYSKWSYMKVIKGGESFTALAEGLQEALQRLGGSPLEHRTDSLSAAYKNLSEDAQVDITARYEALCKHFCMTASRNNPGMSHENGGIESPHGHLKRRIKQALLLRGSYDFESVAAYQAFIDDVVQQHNRRNAKAITHERDTLQALPKTPAIDYTDIRVVVTSSSTIDVRKVTYTVPSQLQGEKLQVRLYDDRLECYLGRHLVCRLDRVYPIGKTTRARNIDYRHIIHSLVKKPQAFRYSQIRDDLLPSADYRAIWDYVNRTMEARAACKFIVGLLHLAATQSCESALGQVVIGLMGKNKKLSLPALQTMFGSKLAPPPTVAVDQHSLSVYNQLIPQRAEVQHV